MTSSKLLEFLLVRISLEVQREFYILFEDIFERLHDWALSFQSAQNRCIQIETLEKFLGVGRAVF